MLETNTLSTLNQRFTFQWSVTLPLALIRDEMKLNVKVSAIAVELMIALSKRVKPERSRVLLEISEALRQPLERFDDQVERIAGKQASKPFAAEHRRTTRI